MNSDIDMSAGIRRPALGAEGWFVEEPVPSLIGSRCESCGVLFFPPVQQNACPSPDCQGTTHQSHDLGRTGRVWSYTNAGYAPPPPYIPTTDPYRPFGIVAVELDDSGIVVLGQLGADHELDELKVGAAVELTVEPLFVDGDTTYTVWKWVPHG